MKRFWLRKDEFGNCIGGKCMPAVEKPTKEPVALVALPKNGTDLAKGGAARKPRAVSVQSAISMLESAALLAKQERLGKEFEEVLFDNLWNLYAR